MDSGTGTDSGTDAGVPPADSGTDSGTPPVDAGTDAGSGSADAGTDAGTDPNAVRIRRFLRHLTASGFEAVPENFTRNPVELFIQQGDALVSVPGAPGAPGEYVFPNVPQGTYYVKFRTSYVVTDVRDLNLSFDVLGRADRVIVEDFQGTANTTLNGLEPWFEPVNGPFGAQNPSSQLHLFSAEVGYNAGIDTFESGIQPGATSLNAENLPLSILTDHVRIEEAKGDRVWVVQLNPRTLGTLSDGGTQNYATAVRAFQLPPFSSRDGEPLPVEGTLQPLILNELPLDWRISAFATLAPEAHPAATVRFSNYLLYPTPYGPEEGWVGYSGELLYLGRPSNDPSDAVGTLVYGNPYPSSWGVLAQVTTSFGVSLPIPDEQPFRISAVTLVSDRPSVFGSGPILPRVRPPRELTLDGTAAYTTRTLSAGGTHVFAWQPPSSGTVNAYIVTLRLIDKFEDSPFRFTQTVASFYLDANARSLRLPRGLFEPGKYYNLQVRSVQSNGYVVTNKPFSLADRIVQSTSAAIGGLIIVEPQAP